MLAVNARERSVNKMSYEATPSDDSGEKKIGNLLIWKSRVTDKIVRSKLIGITHGKNV